MTKAGSGRRSPHPRSRWLAVAAGTLLAGAGAGTLTVSAMDPQRADTRLPPLVAEGAGGIQQPAATPAAQGASWAAQAYQAGLRRCPEADQAFTDACEAQMTMFAQADAAQQRQTIEAGKEPPLRHAAAEESDESATVHVWRGADAPAAAMPTYACRGYGCGHDPANGADRAASGPAHRIEVASADVDATIAAEPAWQRMATLAAGR